MKPSLFLILFLISLPFASASIEVASALRGRYHLGDNIEFLVGLASDDPVDALVKLTLRCDEKELPYYITPVSLEAGIEKVIEVPAIKAFTEGSCTIEVNLDSVEGVNIDHLVSDTFDISGLLELSVSADKSDILPGDTIKLQGSVTKDGNPMGEGTITVRIGAQAGTIEIDGDEFTYRLTTDETMRSGSHEILIEAQDLYGNHREEAIPIDVRAVPSSISLVLDREEFYPGEEIRLKAELLDQAQDPIDEDVHACLSREGLFVEDIMVFDGIIRSNDMFSLTLNSSLPPGDYAFEAEFNGLEDEKTITILPLKKISIEMVGDRVVIENIGNVRYDNRTTIMLEKEGQTYFINKRIKLDAGEKTEIVLSEEMPSGNYTITLPPETLERVVTEERIIEKTTEKIIEKPSYVNQETGVSEDENSRTEPDKISRPITGNVIKGVKIEDRRPFYKKGLSWITGGVVAGRGALMSRPGLASFVMIVIVLSIVIYYNRKAFLKIIGKIRERRENL
ncbi:hypothetical protein KY358_00470 [Candidatus Woesearchaeota archaeon]|nr:hypothetical protein [Candidatus Woesearchaeota archaeon]